MFSMYWKEFCIILSILQITIHVQQSFSFCVQDTATIHLDCVLGLNEFLIDIIILSFLKPAQILDM